MVGQAVGGEIAQPSESVVLVPELLSGPALQEARVGLVSGSSGLDDRRKPDDDSPKPVVERVYKVLVGIPLKGHTSPKSYHDRMLMFKHLGGQEAVDYYEKKNPRYVFALFAIGEILTPYAREQIARYAVSHDIDYVFMIDDDMLAPPDLFYRLVKHDQDIVGALAFSRNTSPDGNHFPVIYEAIEGKDRVTNTDYYWTRTVKNYPRDTLVECDAVGFGAVLIKTSVLKAIEEPRFMGMEGVGEDVALCIKARKKGFRVFMDTSVKLGHLSDPVIVTEDLYDSLMKMTPDEKDRFYGKYTKYETLEKI